MKFIKPFIVLVLTLALSFFTLGLLNPSIEVKNKCEVNAMTAEAFSSVLEPKLLTKWFPQITNVEHLEGMPYGKGSKQKLVLNLKEDQIEIDSEIEDINPYKSFTITFKNHNFTGTLEMFFNQTGRTTLVTSKTSIVGNNIFFRAMYALSKPVFESEYDLAFLRYKKVVEA